VGSKYLMVDIKKKKKKKERKKVRVVQEILLISFGLMEDNVVMYSLTRSG
jgi:hypothetical protein